MTIAHCDLALSTGTNDGTSWANAYQGDLGLVTGMAALAAGDTIYVKNNITSATGRNFNGPTTLASMTNPLRVLGVKSATTNEGGSIVQSDLIPGIRTGNSTRAYAQTGGDAPPTHTVSGSSADAYFNGNIFLYAFRVVGVDNIGAAIAANVLSVMTIEECEFVVSGVGDQVGFGNDGSLHHAQDVTLIHCRADTGAGNLNLFSGVWVKFFDCEIDGTDAGVILSAEFHNLAQFFSCDLSGCSASGIVDVAAFKSGRVELWNCSLPASHTLTTGTAIQTYHVANYGSEDNTAFDSADSEQQLEIHTHQGTVDIETTVVRTGGADDEATDSGGAFAWALVPNNVSDNFVGVVSPWMEKWFLGDGTAQTVTVFFANGAVEGAGDLLEEDEIYMEVMFPDEAGTSIYQYLPDVGAPGDGGGRAQLLSTAADLATDSSTWGSGGNNKQKLTQAIAPDYRGLVRARVIYSKASGPTLYIDPAMTVA